MQMVLTVAHIIKMVNRKFRDALGTTATGLRELEKKKKNDLVAQTTPRIPPDNLLYQKSMFDPARTQSSLLLWMGGR